MPHGFRRNRVGVQIAHNLDGKGQYLFGQAYYVLYLFSSTDWPNRIPFDLHADLESHSEGEWETVLRAWAKRHGIKLKIQWYLPLQQTIEDLHSRRYVAKPQDHWAAIKEWSERHDVPAPDKLPKGQNKIRGWQRGYRPTPILVSEGGG
ncbi:hypothetical protein RUA4292_03172 [Ruegeria atlantica]|uniref:Uncharacterized protein n=1 Tax=Ruegeria atlantica TaxID=81569 RepID=A0A0N7LQU3_9RHOB|nr:hypothetical protein RUA4292_03172 [Ruegeria atlantica]